MGQLGLMYMYLCLLVAILTQKDCSNTEIINFVSFIFKYFAYFPIFYSSIYLFYFILCLSLCAASIFILIFMQLIALYI